MAAGVRNVISNIVSVIEATTADTSYDDTLGWKHVPVTINENDLKDVSVTRLFLVLPTGERDLSGPVLQDTEPFTVTQTFDLTVFYTQGASALELITVVAEDVDRLSYALMRYEDWQQSSTGIWRRAVGSYSLEPAEDVGGVATLTLPVQVTYHPTMA